MTGSPTINDNAERRVLKNLHDLDSGSVSVNDNFIGLEFESGGHVYKVVNVGGLGQITAAELDTLIAAGNVLAPRRTQRRRGGRFARSRISATPTGARAAGGGGGTTLDKATNADVDAVSVEADNATSDDAKYTTVRKVYRAVFRIVKHASTGVRGIVHLARNTDIDAAFGTLNTVRALTPHSGERLIRRIFTPARATKLDGVEANSTADQTPAEIVAGVTADLGQRGLADSGQRRHSPRRAPIRSRRRAPGSASCWQRTGPSSPNGC